MIGRQPAMPVRRRVRACFCCLLHVFLCVVDGLGIVARFAVVDRCGLPRGSCQNCVRWPGGACSNPVSTAMYRCPLMSTTRSVDDTMCAVCGIVTATSLRVRIDSRSLADKY